MVDYLPSKTGHVAIDGTARVLLGTNPKRRAVVLTPHHTSRYTLSDHPGVTDALGLLINPGGTVVVMNYDDYGEWLRGQIFAITDGASFRVTYVEVLDP